MFQEKDRPPDDAPHYPAEKARQGEIVLKKRWQRIIFIVGLAGFVLLALGIQLAAIL